MKQAIRAIRTLALVHILVTTPYPTASMTSLFSPYFLKSVTLRNRIVASPMCQYMAREGQLNEWHDAHYTSLAKGGVGLVILEATAVSPHGRITLGDAGLWDDGQISGFAKVAGAIREQGAVAGIQLGHAGRKAGCTPPWEGGAPLPHNSIDAWTPEAPSAVSYMPSAPHVPTEMTLDDIKKTQLSFAASARRARTAGYQWLELHFAHGFLGQSFLSKSANTREDQYGGSLENRARFLIETVRTVRTSWPDSLPLTVRLGVLEFGECEDQSFSESITVLKWLKDAGVDFVDVGLSMSEPGERIPWGPNFLVPYAAAVRNETGLDVGTSWRITDAKEADAFIREQEIDLVFLARSLLANPHWPYQAARQLAVAGPEHVLPTPYAYWLKDWSC